MWWEKSSKGLHVRNHCLGKYKSSFTERPADTCGGSPLICVTGVLNALHMLVWYMPVLTYMLFVREGPLSQNGWIFGKFPRGWGGHSLTKDLYYKFFFILRLYFRNTKNLYCKFSFEAIFDHKTVPKRTHVNAFLKMCKNFILMKKIRPSGNHPI